MSEQGFRKLSTFHAVSPGFLDFVWAFGEKTTHRDDSYGGYRIEVAKDSPSIGACATRGRFKVAEQTI